MASESEIQNIKNLIMSAESALREARELLSVMLGEQAPLTSSVDEARATGTVVASDDGKVIEGIFDGQNMAGPDGKMYSVPANYASKSKLVEGDRLKLTITNDGAFIYKQIGPIDRQRLIGILAKDEASNEFRVLAGERSYRVLLASVTYFKGDPGDEVVILVPKGKPSRWAAVENIIKPSSPAAASLPVDDLDQPA
ncbi:MAG: hypothetical protein HY976_00940 [Candidatus Kerfeldbacteria bacterium]|nr:hypothetical protein [Candidatus Kerfeldbacteria bacterium]